MIDCANCCWVSCGGWLILNTSRSASASKISEDLFYRVHAILSGRALPTSPQQRAHPDFPLRAFVRCESCGRGLTGSWSKGRSEYYAYYHCRPGCRAINVTKAKLEGLFADELALLQPTPGYMRLLKESVLQIWKARKATVREELANAEQKARRFRKSSTGSTRRSCSSGRWTSTSTTGTPRSCARSSRCFVRNHSTELDELDVEGILAFAERLLTRAADLWVQASLDQRQRFQQLFFPEGIAFDGSGFVGTAVTAPAFSYLRTIEGGNERLVDQNSVSWNQLTAWLRQIEVLRRVA